MKKILYSVFFLCVGSSAVFAQNNTNAHNVATEKATMEKIIGCTQMHTELVKLFGPSFKLDDPKVLAKIQNNIEDKSASECTRKNSLYVIYGEKYTEHLELISNKTKN